ncbi:MAG: hypothetical protein RLZZ373_1198 [Pseudomonadota bacterium]|jgi:hypothetical protein
MADDRAAALVELLSQPDHADLPMRGHRLTCPGDPEAQEWWLRHLPSMHAQIVRQDRQDYSACWVRRAAG